jgi:hypothetical protein
MMGAWTGVCVLFDGDNTQFLNKVIQKSSVEDILWSPVPVNIGSNNLALCLETLGTHGIDKTLDFTRVRGGSISLENDSMSLQYVENGRGPTWGLCPWGR